MLRLDDIIESYEHVNNLIVGSRAQIGCCVGLNQTLMVIDFALKASVHEARIVVLLVLLGALK